MQPVTLTINQQEVSGHPGLTILELARESGITIPTLCHHASLNPIGACRICLVENEANGALLASCVTPIAPGMIINTESPRVLEHRKMILQLMLASHPDACLVCDKGNRCELRRLASEMGIGLIELDRIPQAALTEEVNPFLLRDMSKCILCARCIRACQELVVEGALDYYGRGFKTRPATLFDAPLEYSECTFCGTCVALCPTGALMEREPLYRGSTGTAVKSTCPYCSCGCTISLEVKDNRVARVVPAAEQRGPGTLCAGGSYGCDFIHSPERLTRPLIKEEEGTFREASWEEALAVTAAALSRIKEEHGPESLAVFGAANCTNEENYLLQRFARTVLETKHIDNGSSLYYAAARRAFYDCVGFPGITYPLADLARADLIMVIGADPPASAPLVSYQIKRAVKAQGAKLILIDPRQKTKLDLFAHCRLQPRPGTDLALLKGMAKVIIDEEWTDREFIARKTEKYHDLLASLSNFPLERAAEVSAVDLEQIRRAARLYARAGKAAIIFGSGIMQQPRGEENVRALLNLALLTGHIWRRGGGLRALLRECNAQGASDMGALPDYLPGRQHIDDLPIRKKFETHWQTALPSGPGLGALEMMDQARKGKIKGMLIAGENPAAAFPGSARIEEALTSLDFLAVQELFLTETARLAHVVFPAASFAEKEGAFTSLEGKVQKISPALKPAGESRPDWKIILQLAGAMGRPLPFSSLEQVREEIEELLPFYKCDWGEELPEEEEDFLGARADQRLPLKKFPSFSPMKETPPEQEPEPVPEPVPEPLPEPAPGSAPLYFILLPESTLFRWGSGARSSRSGRLSRFSPAPFLKMNSLDAGIMELSPGDHIEVISESGRLPAVVEYSDELPQGIVTMPRSRSDSPVAALFSSSPEEPAHSSALKRCYIRIERSGHDEPGA
ncbi:MAG: molybdopterin-dependent oxidoreductase [Firmicutes bacterium]|nr:molybdopterin-dependent oxidoreductase [Bacillota bacterium]